LFFIKNFVLGVPSELELLRDSVVTQSVKLSICGRVHDLIAVIFFL